jgi:hypothetical protein
VQIEPLQFKTSVTLEGYDWVHHSRLTWLGDLRIGTSWWWGQLVKRRNSRFARFRSRMPWRLSFPSSRMNGWRFLI